MGRNKSPLEIAPPLVKPKVDVDTLASIDTASLEDSFVYVHCHCKKSSEDILIRIWSTTFLVDSESFTRSQLLHAENISYAPIWTLVRKHAEFSFLLIFGGIPKTCAMFDMVEEIGQPGGFHIKNIKRNETDVYHVDLF